MSCPETPKEQLDFVQNEHPPVVKVKRKLIEELLSYFVLYQTAKKKKPTGTPDFKAYLIDLASKPLELLPDHLKDGTSLSSEASIREILRLANLDYFPPKNSGVLINDLWLLYAYWTIWPVLRSILSTTEGAPGYTDREPFEGFESFLDLSLVKLAFKVGVEISGIRQWGKKLEAIVRLNLKKKCQTETQRMVIYSAFANVHKEPGDTLNRIVERIYKSLQKTELPKKPSKKTIERALKDNHQLIGKCFHKEARGDKSRFIFRHTGV